MSIVAVCSVADLAAVNTNLESAGHGPNNFKNPVYDGSGQPSHATLHCWDSAAFLASLQADGRVTVSTSEIGKPRERIQALIDAEGLVWPYNAPLLPDVGVVKPGEYYRFPEGDVDVKTWVVIQQFNRATFGLHPSTYPALIRWARDPRVVYDWVQPLDAFDAYKLVNEFTGQPDKALHNGDEWEVSAADGAGNNVFEPGVFGWVIAA